MPTPERSKQIAAYISEAQKKAEKYKRDVESGKQTASRWIQLAVKRSQKDEARKDIQYHPEAVARVFEFFFFIRIKTGKQYKRFILTPYQAWILSEIFGWYYKDSTRRYRYAIIYTARKSGKTVFAVAIELYMLMYDREEDPEAYLCATTREQAGQGLRYAKNIVKKSPALNKRLRIQQFQILYDKRNGLLKVLANKPDANDSLNPYVFIIDEMHAHPTLDFFNVMKSGIMERLNPLGLITSTAGFNKDYPFFTMLETGKKVLEEIITDDITFYALYTLDDDDEIEDYSTWEKANPNIGQTIRLDALKKEYHKAALTISEKNNFITKNLNRYLNNLEQWIPDEIYVKCFKDAPQPTNRPPAFMGLDLSATRDIASFVIVYTNEATGKMVVIPEFHFPATDVKRVRDSGIDLGEWIKKGYIFEHTHHNKPTIDQKFIFERIKYWNTIFEIQHINYDKWNSGFIIPEIEQQLYIYCKHFQQQTTWFNFPLKYLERLFFEEEIITSKNPVLRWMFRNVVLYYDGNGNIKIMKNKSQDSVDGPISLAMAVGAWLQYNGDTTAEFFKELMKEKNTE